ncbi:hypothetical protein GKC30_13630 [Pseudodesulfovibrio sp. F-1]|uniref:Helix-turn-helix domain-containing protein n=1 Tax=Pseudodesulfovibrio alkaliphilus TaxID=2661613 RepID=A0A7K1KRE7_9BACT|nr:helix-turn-helix domain-containing protein [Pseudodesulfovibrio alkaliphilus]MUM78676.1 hypothetical protein [Pseudodesulfovibrio alkaliphilus]
MANHLKTGQRFNPYRLFNGMFLPNLVARTRLLSPTDKLVWARLCQFAGGNGLCFPSFTRIAHELGISRSGAIKSVKSLVDKGFLEKHIPSGAELGNQKTNRYYFLWHPIFDEPFNAPGTHCVPGAASGNAPSIQNEPILVHPVDQPGLQSGPKEVHEENQKNTTTTTHSQSEDQGSEESRGGCSSSLCEKQNRYIDLKVKRTVAEGEIRKSSERLRTSLIRKAAQGILDMSDFDELIRWNRDNMKNAEAVLHETNNIQHEKETLHSKLQEISMKARVWWETISSEHPAKCESKPHIYSEDIWIRIMFSKYESIE